MSDANNYAEVLALINRRRRATRSLESVCRLIASAEHMDTAAVQEQAGNITHLLGQRYGCEITPGQANSDSDHLSVAIGVNQRVTLVNLPEAVDEMRELEWCIAAINAFLNLHSKITPEGKQ